MSVQYAGKITVALGNDVDVILKLKKRSVDAVTGAVSKVKASGLSVTAFFSLSNTETAATINADVSVSVPEVGTTGTYQGLILGANVTARLKTYLDAGTPVYLVAKSGSSMICYMDVELMASQKVEP